MRLKRRSSLVAFSDNVRRDMAKVNQRRKVTPRRPRQERSREMVDTILAAATRVFVRVGYARATTNRIADAAGVSVGSLYQYFPSKDAIAIELMRRYRERVVGRIAAHLGEMNEATFRNVVQALIGALLHDDQIDNSLRRVLIERVLRTDARGEIAGFEERVESVLADALRGAKDVVAINDYELCAFILVRAVLAVTHGAVVDSPQYNTPALVDELTRLIVRYIGRRRRP
jgi:AcrR family transcriptional regulator